MSKTLYCGIDAHLARNQVAFLDGEGNQVITCFSLSNNLPGAEELEERIVFCMKEQGFDRVKIATEATAFLDIHLIDFLASSTKLSPYLEELTRFAISKSRNRFVDPDQIAKTLQKVGRESYRIRPGLASSVNLILASILTTIKVLEKSLTEIDKAITKEFAAFPNTLESVKGIGPVYAAGIFSEIGDVRRFGSQIQLAKFAGLTWRKRSSGNFKAEETRMTKTGNKYLRYYLIEAANSLRRHNSEYKAFYEKKYVEVTKHQHKRALALAARKLVRLVFALLTKNQLYQPNNH
ncbi:IS110 family transposase [bacterium]|nr:IS110 family transposase [bacterium]MBU2462095.1 IS110 family transposase [bacterium]